MIPRFFADEKRREKNLPQMNADTTDQRKRVRNVAPSLVVFGLLMRHGLPFWRIWHAVPSTDLRDSRLLVYGDFQFEMPQRSVSRADTSPQINDFVGRRHVKQVDAFVDGNSYDHFQFFLKKFSLGILRARNPRKENSTKDTERDPG
jgi:hypothetical protein